MSAGRVQLRVGRAKLVVIALIGAMGFTIGAVSSLLAIPERRSDCSNTACALDADYGLYCTFAADRFCAFSDASNCVVDDCP